MHRPSFEAGAPDHGITVIACILLAISGLFVFVPQLAQAVGADTVFVIRMSHRVLGIIFVLVPLISAIMAPKGVAHIFKNLFAKWNSDDKKWMLLLPVPVHGEVDPHARPGRGEVRPAFRRRHAVGGWCAAGWHDVHAAVCQQASVASTDLAGAPRVRFRLDRFDEKKAVINYGS